MSTKRKVQREVKKQKEGNQADFGRMISSKIVEVVQSPNPKLYGILVTFAGARNPQTNEVVFSGLSARLEVCQDIPQQLPQPTETPPK